MEDVLVFELSISNNGSILLSANVRNNDFLSKSILSISKDGELFLHSFAKIDGINTDEQGRIIIKDFIPKPKK